MFDSESAQHHPVASSPSGGAPTPLRVLDDLYDEDTFWSRAHARAPYASPARDFEDYRPAYRVGYLGRSRFLGSFRDAEEGLRAEWEQAKGASRLSWSEARHAARAAWNHVSR